MTRETENFEGTGFIRAVYDRESMPKETLSIRVHPLVAEQVDRYAETHDLTRTETMTLLLETGLETTEGEKEKRAYTVRLSEDTAEEVESVANTGQWGSGEQVVEVAAGQLEEAEPETLEDDNPVALSGRFPPALVEAVREWGESRDVSKAVAGEMLIERGLKADPLPADMESPNEGPVYTVRLEPETAELLRRWRLERGHTPDEALDSLARVYAQGKPRDVWVGWAR